MGLPYQRGNLLYRQGRYALAAEEFRKELVQSPSSAGAMSMLALSLVFDGKREEALQHARAAVTTDPQRPFCHYALACAIVGQAPKFTQLMRLGLLSPAGWALRTYRKRLKEAKGAAMEAIRLSPQNPDFIALMSGIELDLSRPRSALKWAEQGLAVKADHVRCANLRAKALSRLGKHKEAKETVKGALALDPESAQTHATSGWTLLQANEPEQALAHFQETVRLNPNDERAVYGLQRAKRATRWLGSPITRRTILVIAVANMCRLMVTEQDKSSGFIVLGTPVVVLVLWAPAKRLWVRYNGR